MENLVWYLPLFGVLALLFVVYKNMWVSKQDPGDDKMQFIAGNIAKGAMAFLKAEYKILSIFVIAVGVLLFFKGNFEFTTIPEFLMNESGEFVLDQSGEKQPNPDYNPKQPLQGNGLLSVNRFYENLLEEKS